MTIRFALLGAGRIGKVHARAVTSNPAAKLVAVADAMAQAAKDIAAQYGCEVRTIEQIASASDIDAVVICTPTDTHADLIEMFARKGKAVFCEMRPSGGFRVWYEPFTCLRIPKLFNLRMDPYERADIVSDQYDDWRMQNAYLMGWMTGKAAEFLQTFIEYPPSQIPASFTIDQIAKSVDDAVKAKAAKEKAQ